MSLVVVERALAEAREFDGAVFPLTLGPNEPCSVEDLCTCASSFQHLNHDAGPQIVQLLQRI